MGDAPGRQGTDTVKESVRHPVGESILNKAWPVKEGVELVMDVVKVESHQIQPDRQTRQSGMRRGLTSGAPATGMGSG